MAKEDGDVLGKIERMLKRFKVRKGAARRIVKAMDADEFLAHAMAEIEKASEEPVQIAQQRLGALYEAVEVAKGASWENGEKVPVPMFEDDTTAARDKSERAGSFPSQGAATHFSANGAGDWGKAGYNTSTNGGGDFGGVRFQPAATQFSANSSDEWSRRVQDLQKRLAVLKGEDEETEKEDDEKKKAAGEMEEDEEKAKKVAGEEDEEDEEDEKKKAAGEDKKKAPFGGKKAPPFGKKPEEEEKKKGLAKRGGKDDGWPADLASPDTQGDDDWGRDG